MKNSDAIRALLDGADRANDPLDAVACQRAATWVRFTDVFGATITNDEAATIAQANSLGEVARQIIQRLAEDYPTPNEDGSLHYLNDDESDEGWVAEFRNLPQDPFEAMDQLPRPKPKMGLGNV
jgi:hypothetical protein